MKNEVRAHTGEPQRRHGRVLSQGIAGAVILAVFIGAAWFLRSAAFRDWVRGRVVARLEQMTGGRVEMRSLEWDLARLHFVVDDLTIHGLEGPDQAPYFHADRIAFRVKILSLLQQEVGLRAVEVDRPVAHLIIYSDGRTNQPSPRTPPSRQPVQRLFALQVDSATIRQGVLLVNDRPIPLNMSADDVSVAMAYVRAAKRYDVTVNIVRLRTSYQGLGPLDAAAAAEFSLLMNRLEVKSLRLSSGQSTLEASGQLTDFARPQASFQYRARLDLTELAGVARLPQLQRGLAEITGSGNYAVGNYHTAGKIALREVEYRDATVRLPAFSGGAEFNAARNVISLPHLFASAFGGTVTGNAEVKNWDSAEQQGTMQLRVTNIPVSRLAAAVSTQSLPLDRLRLAGGASGPVDVTWRGAPSRAVAAFAVTVTPPAHAAPGELPVAATLQGQYSLAQQAAELTRLDISARSLHVTGAGRAAARSSLNFTASAGDVRDIHPLLAALNAGPQLPAVTEGSGSFAGTLSGRLSSPEIAGHLTLANFVVAVPLLPKGPVSEPHFARFDSFAADMRYSAARMAMNNAVLRRGTEQANFSASAALDNGKLRDTSAFTAQAALRNFSVEELQGLLGWNYPLTGTMSATVRLGGALADPRGAGRFALTQATLYGEPMQAVDADLVLANQEAQATNLLMVHNGGRITGSAAYNLRTMAFRFNVVGSNFSLAQFRQLQTRRITLAGLLNFDARGSGTREAPVIDAGVHVRNLLMNGEPLGDVDATAVTSGGVMRVSGRSNFRLADLSFDGAVAMHDRFPANIKLTMQRLDVDPLLKVFLQGKFTGHSSIGGVITVSGPLRDPKLLTINGDISQMSAELERLRIQNDGPLRFSVVNQVLKLDQFRLLGEDTRLGATGQVELTGARNLDLRADGHMQLKLLESFNPDLHASGVVDFAVLARGTVSAPRLVGRATVVNGALTNINFPNGLSNMNGALLFNQDRMQIQSFTATSGGGNLTFTGFVTYGNGMGFNISAAAKDVRLRYPQGMSSTLDANLRLTGSTTAATLAGTAQVTRFSMSPQFDLAAFLVRSRQTPEVANPASPLNNLRLDLHVTSTPDLQVSTTMAKVSGDVDLNVRGSAARPALLGRINVTEGQVTFNGATYQLERGDISFSNPVRIEPVVDMEMTTRVRDYDITLGFHGPVDHMSVTYRSDPPVPTTDIISLLAFGTTREEAAMTTGPNPTFAESASNAILGQALSEAQTSRVQRLFGVSRVKIAPETTGAETNPNARVTIEQQVSKDFTITYITDLTHTTSQQQIIEVEYNYSRNLSIVGSRDQYGIVSFDVRIRQRKK